MTAISSSIPRASLVALPAPQILEIVGADATQFSQAQFSSNVNELANGQWQWSAWLSAQGRVRAFFHLLRDDDQHFRLVLRGGSAAALRDALARYVFRAKVQLRVPQNIAAWIEYPSVGRGEISAAPSAQRFERNADETRIALPGAIPRHLVLNDAGATPSAADTTESALNENYLADIDAALISLDPALEDKLLPTWIGLDALDATSTGKGCYPGQEIVARLHFKGGNKRWLYRLTFSAECLPKPGTALGDQGGDAGLIINAAWTGTDEGAALAVLSEGDCARLKNLKSPVISLHTIEQVKKQSDI